jgi:hypothetical protein
LPRRPAAKPEKGFGPNGQMEKRNDDWTFQRGKKTGHTGGSNWVGVGSLHESDSPHSVSQCFWEETAKCEGDHSSDTMPQENGRLIAGQAQYRLQAAGEILHAVISIGWSRGQS